MRLKGEMTMLELHKCNRCGKEMDTFDGRKEVTCKHIRFWEDDTKRYLCPKCYDKFVKYMDKNYNDFFIYLKKMKDDTQ